MSCFEDLQAGLTQVLFQLSCFEDLLAGLAEPFGRDKGHVPRPSLLLVFSKE